MIKQEILVTVDNIIFTMLEWKIQVLLIKRLVEPFKDQWALPGWFVVETESLQDAAHRKLAEETNVKNTYLEQLYTFSEVDRDPRGRVISCGYMAIVDSSKINLNAWSAAKEVKFFPIDKLPALGFDHKEIMKYAIQRLQRKIEYTNVAQYLLPAKFTLSDLQKVYEIVLGKELDVRNFRKKIDKLAIVKETGEKEVWVQYRPAKLYQFTDKKIKIVEIL